MANANCPSGDPNSSPKHANGHASPLDLIRRFNRLQSDRVEGFGHFEEAFTSFLSDAPEFDFDSYKLRVAEITVSFKSISDEIIHIKNSLRDTHNQASIATLIEKMQDLEETKLKVTADCQIARKNLHDQPQNEDLEQEVLGFKKRLDSLAEEISEVLEDLKYECEDLYSRVNDEDSLRFVSPTALPHLVGLNGHQEICKKKVYGSACIHDCTFHVKRIVSSIIWKNEVNVDHTMLFSRRMDRLHQFFKL